MSVENYLPGDLCSGLIICWRKSSGEMSPGEKFLGEICDEFGSMGLDARAKRHFSKFDM